MTDSVLTHQQVDYEKGLREYVEKAFRTKMPALIDFSLQNQTLSKLLRHLKRHATGSVATAYQYVYGVWRFQLWMNKQPDMILSECWSAEGEPLPRMLLKHAQLVDDFVGHLQEQKLAPGSVANHAKGVKALYRANGLRLELPKYPRTIVCPGRSPTKQELQKILALADLHQKCIILLLATGGFREGTLCRLTYGDLREDLESGIVPVLVRVRPTISKGLGYQTRGYWTFLPQETIECLKAHLEERRHGNRWFEPEEISDASPLIRNRGCAREVRPITPGAVWQTVHELYVKAGIVQASLDQRGQRRHSLSVHSLRWFFRTELSANGVSPEHCEFMMGHKCPLYNDIQMKGVEFLRQKYASADFSITPKPKLSDRQIIEAFVRGRGLDPQQILRQESFAEPHRIVASPQEKESRELRTLTSAFAETFFQENNIPVLSSAHSDNPRATIGQPPTLCSALCRA